MMTVARLQQIYLYYSYAVLAVLLFILLKQDDFALYWVLFYPLFCNHAIFDLADCLKNQKPFYDKFLRTNVPATPFYLFAAMGCLLFLESNDKGFNWLLFTIGLLSITLPNLYFARQFNHLVAQLPKATRQPEKWSAGRKLFWLITGLVPLGISILSFYAAFTRDNQMVQSMNFGLLTLLISILMYRHLLRHWGLGQPENTQTN